LADDDLEGDKGKNNDYSKGNKQLASDKARVKVVGTTTSRAKPDLHNVLLSKGDLLVQSGIYQRLPTVVLPLTYSTYAFT
jgi:hypothetical protein